MSASTLSLNPISDLKSRNELTLGRGYSELASMGKKEKVKTALVKLTPQKEASICTETCSKIVIDEQDFFSKLNFRAGLSLPQDHVSDLTAKFKANTKKSSESNSLLLLVHFRQTKSRFKYPPNIEINSEAMKVYSDSGSDEFYEQFGESYISEVEYGKIFTVLIKLYAKDSQDFLKIKSKLGSENLKSVLQAGLENELNEKEIRCELSFSGMGVPFEIQGVSGLKSLSKIDEWVDNIFKQCNESRSDDVIVSIKTTSYGAVGGLKNFKLEISDPVFYAEKYLKKMKVLRERAELLLGYPEDIKGKSETVRIIAAVDELENDLRNCTISKIKSIIASKKAMLIQSQRDLNGLLQAIKVPQRICLDTFADYTSRVTIQREAPKLLDVFTASLALFSRSYKPSEYIPDPLKDYKYKCDLPYNSRLAKFLRLTVTVEVNSGPIPKVAIYSSKGSKFFPIESGICDLDITSMDSKSLQEPLCLLSNSKESNAFAVINTHYFSDDISEIAVPISPRDNTQELLLSSNYERKRQVDTVTLSSSNPESSGNSDTKNAVDRLTSLNQGFSTSNILEAQAAATTTASVDPLRFSSRFSSSSTAQNSPSLTLSTSAAVSPRQ